MPTQTADYAVVGLTQSEVVEFRHRLLDFTRHSRDAKVEFVRLVVASEFDVFHVPLRDRVQ